MRTESSSASLITEWFNGQKRIHLGWEFLCKYSLRSIAGGRRTMAMQDSLERTEEARSRSDQMMASNDSQRYIKN